MDEELQRLTGGREDRVDDRRLLKSREEKVV
jgi:hypothetical protein